MTRKAIGRILFTFSCMIAMVLVFGLQASQNLAYAAPGGKTVSVTYVSQNVTWDGFGTGSYTIEYGGTTSMFTSKPTKPTNGKVVVRVGANVSQNPQSRTGYVYAYQMIQNRKTRVATLTVVQNGHSHSWSAWKTRTAATCTQNGVQYRTCAVCQKEETSSIPYTNHLFQNWTVTKQPTCAAAGVETGTCSKCGAKKTRDYGSATGRHTYGSWYVSKNPTCSGAGTETHKCTGCGRTENRTIGSYGHVYAQTNCAAESGTSSKMKITLKCKRCGGTAVCSDASKPVKGGSDVILCYRRADGTNGFQKQTDSFLDYKATGNYGRDTYLFYYTSYAQYNGIWNYFIPSNPRNIYDYGHAEAAMFHEFSGESVHIEDIIYGKKAALNRKSLSGSMYLFTCHAGDYLGGTGYLYPPAQPFPSKAELERVANLFGRKYSTLRYYAYLCPDAFVFGIKDDALDYDEYDNDTDVWLPTPHRRNSSSSGKFVAEYFDSSKNTCNNTMMLGTSIKATYFLESYL